MCPLRFLLVFFSAVLAGYFAWKTVSSSPELISDDSPVELNDKQGLNFKKVSINLVAFRLISSIPDFSFLFTGDEQKMENGFWVFVDMASGRYLWRNLKEMREKSQ